ncbi:ABC transporter permease [Amnibacterium sp.]|uniref:ABC transporter permease n=1 Tax=Amnibacterium sp. TaxID=1872496 RepID=UPI0026318D75|nr:ABC transporter permease subunit [Amnibacterium sp.]MCU1472065.1 glycine/betaine transporter permease [Amnibacterium sp.]
MILLLQGVAWLLDPANWADSATPGLLSQLLGQLGITLASIVVAVVVAVPLGVLIGHTGRGRLVAIVASNAARALPTLGLFSVVVIALTLDPQWLAPVIPLALLGIPPLLAGTYAGIEAVDGQVVDAARAMGMTEWQVLLRVEIPLGAPLIVGGLRAAVLQTVATATLASFYGFTTIGNSILLGPDSNQYIPMIGGSLLVTVLALAIDGLFALLQRSSAPRGVSRGARRTTNAARGRFITSPAGTPISRGN